MSVPLHRPATVDGLFLWVMHRFAEEFEDQAIVKGGIALRLLDCPRATTDIDYVFVPYKSKKDVVPRIEAVLTELEDADVEVEVHSKMVRANLRLDDVAIQVEVSVDTECPSEALSTSAVALDVGFPSRLVRVMQFDRALSHKLGAWNERRLLRDLYDVYFLVVRQGVLPHRDTLMARLSRITSRLPRLKATRSMTLQEFRNELQTAAEHIDEVAIKNELAPVLPATEIDGLARRLRSGLVRAVELLE